MTDWEQSCKDEQTSQTKQTLQRQESHQDPEMADDLPGRTEKQNQSLGGHGNPKKEAVVNNS